MTCLESNAQIGNDKWNVTAELTLPIGTHNKVFKDYLKGLVSFQPKFQYKPFKNWYVAFGPKYMFYQVNEYKVPFEPNVSNDSVVKNKKTVSMIGGMHVIAGDLEVGYTNWVSERVGIDLGMKVGIANQRFITSGTKYYGKQQVTSIYLQPTFSLIVAADEAVAYRWIVGYNFSGYAFNPTRIGSTQSNGYKGSDLKGSTQSLLIGFGISYYFKNKRTDVFLDEE